MVKETFKSMFVKPYYQVSETRALREEAIASLSTTSSKPLTISSRLRHGMTSTLGNKTEAQFSKLYKICISYFRLVSCDHFSGNFYHLQSMYFLINFTSVRQ